MSYYKIGNIIVKSTTKYICDNYPQVENPFKTEKEYNQQFIPFQYTNNFSFKITKTPVFNLFQSSIYSEICDKLDIYIYNNDRNKYMFSGVYINEDFIKKYLIDNLPPDIKQYAINKMIYKFITIEDFNYCMINEFANEYFNYNKLRRDEDAESKYFENVKNKNIINNIYADERILIIVNANELYKKIINKLSYFINVLKVSNEILECTKFEILSILVERLNININNYQFDYDLYVDKLNEKKKYYDNIINQMKHKNYKSFKHNMIDLDLKNSMLRHFIYSINNIKNKYISCTYKDSLYSEIIYNDIPIRSSDCNKLCYISYNNTNTINYNGFKYVYMPNHTKFFVNHEYKDEDDDEDINEIENINKNNYIFYYVANTKFYKPKLNDLKNNYLSDIIVNSSNLFVEFSKEYSINEIEKLDLRNELKDYEEFNKLFKNFEVAAETIHHLIYYLKSNIINDKIKNIIYNLYYLQMSEIIEIVQIISNKYLKYIE